MSSFATYLGVYYRLSVSLSNVDAAQSVTVLLLQHLCVILWCSTVAPFLSALCKATSADPFIKAFLHTPTTTSRANGLHITTVGPSCQSRLTETNQR